jgi:hypothetical protein
MPKRYNSDTALVMTPVYSACTAVNLDENGVPLTYARAMAGPDGTLWNEAAIEEFDRLIEKTGSMQFIPAHEKPADRSASYYNPRVRIKLKEGKIVRRVRGTVGGDRIDYPGAVSANAAELTTIKLLLNAVVSENAHFITADITDFYLGTPLPRTEYIRISLSQIPEAIQTKYKVHDLMATNSNHVMVAITKGMYGLPQAGILAQERLLNHLSKHGYRPVPNTPCLLRHDTRDVVFSLVVDDFGIKYKHQADAEHLLLVLQELYTITIDWSGAKYCGIHLKFDKTKRSVTLSMPGYVTNAIQRFTSNDSPAAHSPAVFIPPDYKRIHHQPATADDDSPLLPPDRAKRIQEIVGVFLYYARAVDPSMLAVINKIGSLQAKPTEQVEAMATRLLQYAATWPDASITYNASNMQLRAFSDASHLSETKSRSRAGGVLYLGSMDPSPADPTSLNGSIECISSIIPTVAASATEAEYAALFLVGQTAAGLRSTLADLGYPQCATPIICDNACAVGIANDKVKQKRSKAIDMRFHWIRERVRQGQFTITWQPGMWNLADFFTKIHAVRHHLQVRRLLVNYPRADPHLPATRQRRIAKDERQQARRSGEGVLMSST